MLPIYEYLGRLANRRIKPCPHAGLARRLIVPQRIALSKLQSHVLPVLQRIETELRCVAHSARVETGRSRVCPQCVLDMLLRGLGRRPGTSRKCNCPVSELDRTFLIRHEPRGRGRARTASI